MVYFIIIILFLLLFWFFYEDRFYEIIMYIGLPGVGKTLTIAKKAIKYNKKGYNVYTNVESIRNAYYFDPKDLDKFKPKPNSVMLLDEIGLLWDARDFKNFKCNEFFKYHRQYKCRIELFSQAWSSDLDLKIRNMVSRIYLMQRIGKIVIYRPVIKRLGVIQRPDGTGDLVDTYSYGLIFDYHFTYLPRYYGLFETYNPPKRDNIRYILTKCDKYYITYKNTKNWAFMQFINLIAKIKLIGAISNKIAPILAKARNKIKLSSSGSASVPTQLFWLSRMNTSQI